MTSVSVGVKLWCSMSQLIGGDGGDEVTLSLGVSLTTFSAPQIGDWQICGHWNTPLWEDCRHPRTGRTGGETDNLVIIYVAYNIWLHSEEWGNWNILTSSTQPWAWSANRGTVANPADAWDAPCPLSQKVIHIHITTSSITMTDKLMDWAYLRLL